MRILIALLAAALAAPTAAAAGSRLEVAPAVPEATAGEQVNVTLRLTLEDFWCHDGKEVVVALEVRGDGVATGTPAQALARLIVDDDSHFADAWTGEVAVPVTVDAAPDAEGMLQLVGTFSSDADGCFAPNGFAPAEVLVGLGVRGLPATQPPPETPPPEQPPAADPAPPATTPPTGQPPAQRPTPPPEAPPTGEPQEAVDRLPEGKGYIGDYEPDERYVEVPGVGAALAGAVLAAAALLARRKA